MNRSRFTSRTPNSGRLIRSLPLRLQEFLQRGRTKSRQLTSPPTSPCKISVGKDAVGILRLLPQQPTLFQVGSCSTRAGGPTASTLPPPTKPSASTSSMNQKLGFNMARKHVKVEPERWYYWADKLGLLVWQDMPRAAYATRTPKEGRRGQHPGGPPTVRRTQLEMIDRRRNHSQPSSCGFRSTKAGASTTPSASPTGARQKIRPSAPGQRRLRLDRPHTSATSTTSTATPARRNPKTEPTSPSSSANSAAPASPFPDHTWQQQVNWSYKAFKTPDELTDAYTDLIAKTPSPHRHRPLRRRLHLDHH